MGERAYLLLFCVLLLLLWLFVLPTLYLHKQDGSLSSRLCCTTPPDS